ncbi:hypothetical protein BDV10DRAFT_114814 [Aspergillus recurvatus]
MMVSYDYYNLAHRKVEKSHRTQADLGAAEQCAICKMPSIFKSRSQATAVQISCSKRSLIFSEHMIGYFANQVVVSVIHLAVWSGLSSLHAAAYRPRYLLTLRPLVSVRDSHSWWSVYQKSGTLPGCLKKKYNSQKRWPKFPQIMWISSYHHISRAAEQSTSG